MEIFVNLQYKQTQYSRSNDSSKKIDTNEMCNYYDRDEACDKTIDTDDAVNYYKYRVGSNGGWGKNGDLINISLKLFIEWSFLLMKDLLKKIRF